MRTVSGWAMNTAFLSINSGAYGLMVLYLLKIRGDRRPIVKALLTTGMLEILGVRNTAFTSSRSAWGSSSLLRRCKRPAR